MRIRRRLPILFGVVLVGAAIALAVVLRKHAPPEPARLLPGADGYLYVNLKCAHGAPTSRASCRTFRMRRSTSSLSRQPDSSSSATWIRRLSPSTILSKKKANAAPPEPPRFSEVFVGRIEGERLRSYLGKISGSVDNYRSVDIYNIPLEGRTLRVAVLGFDTVAASNHDDPMVIRGIVDRSRKVASPFGGPALLRRYYKYVPLASLGWAIFKVDPVDSSAQPECACQFLFTSQRRLWLPHVIWDGCTSGQRLLPEARTKPSG